MWQRLILLNNQTGTNISNSDGIQTNLSCSKKHILKGFTQEDFDFSVFCEVMTSIIQISLVLFLTEAENLHLLWIE